MTRSLHWLRAQAAHAVALVVGYVMDMTSFARPIRTIGASGRSTQPKQTSFGASSGITCPDNHRGRSQ